MKDRSYLPNLLIINGVLIASKQYPLPKRLHPGESEEARDAFNEMAAEAALEGINITAFSTYRSFDYQTRLYQRYVDSDGQEAADRYSARPGYSEHQTGLAFDIGEVNGEKRLGIFEVRRDRSRKMGSIQCPPLWVHHALSGRRRRNYGLYV